MPYLCEAFPPQAVLYRSQSPACAASSADEAVLLEILRPDIALALWLRPQPRGWTRLTAPLLEATPFRAIAEGPPDTAVDELLGSLGHPVPAELAMDLLGLARLFSVVAHQPSVRLRLEGLDHDACHRFHRDAIGLRLLCTYRGAGTEWTLCGPDCRAPHRMPAGAVALLKGTAHQPPPAEGCLHRSPPVSRLPEGQRRRLLLTIDEPGLFD